MINLRETKQRQKQAKRTFSYVDMELNELEDNKRALNAPVKMIT